MERWAALLPDRTANHVVNGPRIQLIGRLPSEAYIAILQNLPIPDIISFALCSRKLASLTRDDRVWKKKLECLDYRGPGAIPWAAKGKEVDEDEHSGSTTAIEEPTASYSDNNDQLAYHPAKANGNGKTSIEIGSKPFSSSSAAPASGTAVRSNVPAPFFSDEEFGDFFDGDGDVSLVRDDGFGEFQDFASGDSDAPFGQKADGRKVTTQASKEAEEDLMMMFDDLDDKLILSKNEHLNQENQKRQSLPDRNLTFVATASKHTPTTSVSHSSAAVTVPLAAASIEVNGNSTHESKLRLRDVFIAHHKLLIPYYISLIKNSTSSILFTSPNLTPMNRAQLLASLVRFCLPSVAPTRSLPQRMTVLRNVQSAMDFFESALLAEFERADTRKDVEAMRDKAIVLWELNQSTSVVQVFVQKREIFYEQGHNPSRNLVKLEGPSGEKVDGIDFSAMDAYMKYVLSVVKREGSLIAKVFPFEADVLIYFAERIANDVISDYITSLLSDAQALQAPLFLLATAATFGQVYRLVDVVLEVEPKSPLVTKERIEDVVFKMFEPLMDDYLQEEGEWIRTVLEGLCHEWDGKTASDLAISDPTFLASQNPAQVKKNVLAGFTKVLLLPVTIIPKTASFGLNAITYGATGAFNTFAQLGGQLSGSGGGGVSTPTTKTAALPPLAVSAIADHETEKWGDEVKAVTAGTGTTTPQQHGFDSPIIKGLPQSGRFDRMQLLLSLDTALQLIQSDRDCLKRVQTFARYPGTYGRKVRDAIEEVFIILLQTLGEKHVVTGFEKARRGMENYKVEDHDDDFIVVAEDRDERGFGGDGEVNGKGVRRKRAPVAPLVQFFELVHIGDTIQQMVEVYFDKEMAGFIDKKDFLNTVVREKKRFESSLDDAVAQGLNAGVNILMNQVEHIIVSGQGLRDFSPPEEELKDLDISRPTKACEDAVDCLKVHCEMLKGSTDKQILEVFHQEVGIRLHGILLKHLKRQVVSVDGGFQLISDLNAYHSFISNLRQPPVTAYFTALKMVGEIYIVDNPKELGQLVRDVSRYEGTLSADDLYECVQRRADWKKIESQVEKQLFGLKLADDCTIS